MKPKTKITPQRDRQLKRLAQEIARELMKLYCGRTPEYATRLAMMRGPKPGQETEIGGLYKGAVIYRTYEVLCRAEAGRK